VEFQLDRLPDDSVDVAEFGREDLGVLEFNEVIVVEPMFRHRRFVDVQAYVPALFFYSGLSRSTSLSDVHLVALTGDAIHAWSPQPQIVLHRTEEAGDLPRRQANTLKCCAWPTFC
jgi:hypothetical protein